MARTNKTADPSIVKLRTEEARVSALGIAQHTASAIEKGAYPPGSRLREQELADLFACSRAPVREALRILESQGIVVIEPMKGARVATIDDKNFLEVFLIRRALASLIAQELARAPASPKRAKFIADAARLEGLAASGCEQDEFSRQVSKAIRSLSAASSLDRTIKLLQGLTFGRQAFQAEFLDTDRRRLAMAKIWTRLSRAIEAGDPARARDAMEKLFDQAFAHVNAWLKSRDGTE